MLHNLENARKTKGISLSQIASVIGVNRYQTVSDKIKGETKFTFDEALKIHQALFPEYDLVFLFEPYDIHAMD